MGSQISHRLIIRIIFMSNAHCQYSCFSVASDKAPIYSVCKHFSRCVSRRAYAGRVDLPAQNATSLCIQQVLAARRCEATRLFWVAALGLTDTINFAAAQARGHDDLLGGPDVFCRRLMSTIV